MMDLGLDKGFYVCMRTAQCAECTCKHSAKIAIRGLAGHWTGHRQSRERADRSPQHVGKHRHIQLGDG